MLLEKRAKQLGFSERVGFCRQLKRRHKACCAKRRVMLRFVPAGAGGAAYLISRDSKEMLRVLDPGPFALGDQASATEFLRHVDLSDPATGEPLASAAAFGDGRRDIRFYHGAFSLDSTVGLMCVFGDEHARATAEEAYWAGASAACNYLNDAAVFLRRLGNFEAAGTAMLGKMEDLNDAKEPFPHVHLAAPAGARAPSGASGKLSSRDFLSHIKPAGFVGQAAAAQVLVERGYEVERVKDWFRLRGFAAGAVGEFSTRSDEIRGLAWKFGTSAAGREVANKETKRGTKDPGVTLESLMPELRPRMEKHGVSEEMFRRLRGVERRRRLSSFRVGRTMREALRELSGRRSYFYERDFVEEVARRAQWLGCGPLVDESRAFLQRSRSIVRLGASGPHARFTSRALYKAEAELLRWAERSRHSRKHLVGRGVISIGLQHAERRAGYPLDEELRDCVWHLAGAPGSVSVLDCAPGGGVVAVLTGATEAWRASGYRVLAVAVAARRAEEIERQRGVPAVSVAKLLFEHGTGRSLSPSKGPFRASSDFLVGRSSWAKLQETHVLRRLERQRTTNERRGFDARATRGEALARHAIWGISGRERDFHIRNASRLDRYGVDSRTIVVLEGAQRVSTPDLLDLANLVRKGGGKLALVGDSHRPGSRGPGGAFAALARRLGTPSLFTGREGPLWARRAESAIRAGESGRALYEYGRQGRLKVLADDRATADQMLAEWDDGGGTTAPRDHLLLAATPERTRRLNEAAQQARLQRGLVGRSSAVRANGVVIRKGDRVRVKGRSRGSAAHSGELGTVVGIRLVGGSLRVRLDRGPKVWVAGRLVELGYALTGLQAQDVHAEHAYVWLGGIAQDRELAALEFGVGRDTRLYTSEVDDHGAGVRAQLWRKRADQLAHEMDAGRDNAR